MRAKTEANQSAQEFMTTHKPYASKVLELAKKQEAEKMKNGYRYIKQGDALILKKL